jgi:hypothetical protein
MGYSVDQDIRLLGQRNWESLALNKEEWKERLKEGQGSHRAVEPMMMMMMI